MKTFWNLKVLLQINKINISLILMNDSMYELRFSNWIVFGVRLPVKLGIDWCKNDLLQFMGSTIVNRRKVSIMSMTWKELDNPELDNLYIYPSRWDQHCFGKKGSVEDVGYVMELLSLKLCYYNSSHYAWDPVEYEFYNWCPSKVRFRGSVIA